MLVHATRIEETGGFRIRDFGITCGSSMEDRRRGRIRRISNQWVKGTIRIYTVGHLTGNYDEVTLHCIFLCADRLILML